ncbi:cellulose biosynthesis cyclic di-GMP-binding regulatory protein BcsB [Sphingomonas sp. MAHUQ-71]|uniref:Cellulose biosynthesis cyclic di-GMP-binding regulatory protein BcsB n=1 Tax=Sphingomonas oryzagri TaxID=3042314 RepID=A0ABT6N0H3_9SPHN|nr:cellulose biosynthesis cyclic di-GMP-binding regulatory protein BcsB [Sphingomonas oryzagri]
MGVRRLSGPAIVAGLLASTVIAVPTALAQAPLSSAPSSAASSTAGAAIAPNAPLLSLAGLGYRDGIDFTGYEGKRDLFFRVPAGAWLSGTHLLLPYEASAATGAGRRTLTVMAGGKVLRQIALSDGAGIADVPVPADAIDGGALRTTLIYSGGESANRCADRRMGADHLHLDPAGGLALDIAAGAQVPVGVAAALIGPKPTIALPASATPEQAAAALTVIAARGGGTIGTAGDVQIAGASDPALRSIAAGGKPGLAIGGQDPAAAARAAFSGLSDLLAAPAIQQLTLRPHRDDRLHLSDLGVDPRATEIADEGGWTIALPASRLPKGKTVKGLSIDVSAVPDGNPHAASLSAWMNGVLLGSAPLQPGTTHLDVRVPDGMVHSLNGIEVRVTRQQNNDCGDIPRGFPVQLLGTSEIVLGDAGKLEAFHDFAAAAGQGLTVVVPDASALPLAGKAVAGLVGADVPIKVSYGTIPADGPVLYIGTTPPPGTTPKLGLANGRITLADDKGQADIDLPDAGTQTLAQLLDANGRPILWVRPAAQGPVPATLWLDQGDVAFVAGDGSVTPLSTAHDRLTPLIGPPPPPPWWQTYQQWIFLALGLLVGILIVAWSFRPSIKKAKPGQDA